VHIGDDATSIDITPGATGGVLYGGMSADGSTVYFTTKDTLTTAADQDTDSSEDLFRADVSTSAATLTRVSLKVGESAGGIGDTDSCAPAGNSARPYWNSVDATPNCDAVAIGGGGGVARETGIVYFLSPELLEDGAGTEDAPNLYMARPGEAPRFVATLESSDNEPLKPKEHLFERSFGRFSYPEGVAIDHATGKGYVLDTFATSGLKEEEGETIFVEGAYVQRFEPDGSPDLTYADNSKLFETPFGPFHQAGEGFPPGSKPGLPTQIAVDNSGGATQGSLYVPDFFQWLCGAV
jgi:hypothetical protein